MLANTVFIPKTFPQSLHERSMKRTKFYDPSFTSAMSVCQSVLTHLLCLSVCLNLGPGFFWNLRSFVKYSMSIVKTLRAHIRQFPFFLSSSQSVCPIKMRYFYYLMHVSTLLHKKKYLKSFVQSVCPTICHHLDKSPAHIWVKHRFCLALPMKLHSKNLSLPVHESPLSRGSPPSRVSDSVLVQM